MYKKPVKPPLRPVATWLTDEQLEKFKAVAVNQYRVTPTALLRAMIVDVIAEEGNELELPPRLLTADLFVLARQEEL